MKKLIPQKKQWGSWSLPSKSSYLGAWIGAIALFLFIASLFIPSEPKQNISENNSQTITSNSRLQAITQGDNNTTIINIKSDDYPELDKSVKNKAIFAVSFIQVLHFQWPGSLLVLHPSPKGKVLSPVSLALWVEVVNTTDKISRIQSYNARALFRYDEGGSHQIKQVNENERKFEFIPSGNIVEKWRSLYTMGQLNDQVYFIGNKGHSRCRRLDFSKNNFDTLARRTQLKPGESIMGWIFFEYDLDLRGQPPELIKLELSLINSTGEKNFFFTNKFVRAGSEKEISYLSGGELVILEGEYDLTKEQYIMAAMVDLKLPAIISSKNDDITPPRTTN